MLGATHLWLIHKISEHCLYFKFKVYANVMINMPKMINFNQLFVLKKLYLALNSQASECFLAIISCEYTLKILLYIANLNISVIFCLINEIAPFLNEINKAFFWRIICAAIGLLSIFCYDVGQ